MSAEVKGFCPACGWTGLFLGLGGYVTCSQYDCPNPSAAAELLLKSRYLVFESSVPPSGEAMPARADQ